MNSVEVDSITVQIVPSSKSTVINSVTEVGNPVPTMVNSVPPSIFMSTFGVILVIVTIIVFGSVIGEIGIKPLLSLTSTSH